MISDDIDKHILLIANLLFQKVSKEDITNAYLQNGFTTNDIYLLLAAGQIIYEDRINASAKKSTFRRII